MQDYYLGLDMGTNSVGWAVTNPSYELIKKKGKDLWGIRGFEEASVSSDRRAKRTNRRRLQREIVRIGRLKAIFDDEIQKVDSLFFVRMENSKYFSEDKDARLVSINGIFDDKTYGDKEYFEEYPTIFHLRKALIEDMVKHDEKYSRLVYLAILNMFKHRGHFLNAGLSDDGESLDTASLFDALFAKFNELFEGEAQYKVEELESILADRQMPKSEKVEEMIKACVICSQDESQSLKVLKEILKGVCGLKFDIKKIYDDLETEEKLSKQFSDASYEDEAISIAELIGEDRFDLIDAMKALYDAGLLCGILKGNKYLSFACVEDYEKHAKDLTVLKHLYKEYASIDEYDSMFRLNEAGSYSAYIGSTVSRVVGDKPSRRKSDGRKRDDLYGTIKKFIKDKGIDTDDSKYILSEMDNGSFLPKQRTSDNGVIPNQLHMRELKAILKNAEKSLDFLKEKDESGLTNSEKIQMLLSFRVPYFVGPVTERSKMDNGNGWVIRKEDGEVFPWNLEQKIDLDRTKEEFIKNLIRDCTYLSGEKVLPKNSLMYEAYCVLNEINNIRIDGERISVALKQDIYNDLFKKGKRVTRKGLCSYLVNRGLIASDTQITGIDVTINSALTSYGRFSAVFGEDMNRDECLKMCERIIELATIFGDSKSVLSESIKKEFGDRIDDSQLKRILGYKFSDWGRLSKQMLELPGCNPETGEQISLIRALWETSYNFMELINKDEFLFKSELEKKQKKLNRSLSEFTADDLKDFYFSAPVRRMIWQTILIIKEIEKIMGCAPAKIFVEMTRSEDEKKGDKGRKDSRGKQLQELYKNIKDDSKAWIAEIKNADANGSLRSKKLYLYYLQMGRCLYTGERIDLVNLMSANSDYDIDHIYPRHYVKDDNITNNLVLVSKKSNAYKSDDYPLMSMKPEVYDLWRMLHEKGFMSDEKYKRLMSREPFSEEQLAGFIARQLVETSQGTKGVADILKMLMPSDETKIIYAKAGNVSDFRRDNELLKSRTVNDFHHAKDAYLNIVVGNVYYTKFTQNPRNFISKEYARDVKKYHFNLGKMFAWDVQRDGYVAWTAGADGTIATVKSVMDKNTPMMTRMTFEAKGAISKETLYGADKTDPATYMPLKTKDARMRDIKKYGGFTGVNGAYFFLVEHTVKGKRIRTLENMPIYLAESKVSTDALIGYCADDLKLVEPKIVYGKIKMQSLVKIDGFYYRISGRTGNRIVLRNNVPMCLKNQSKQDKQEWINYIHKIDKFVEGGVLSPEVNKERNCLLYEVLKNKHTDGYFAKRKNAVGEILTSGMNKFEKLSVEEQCKVIEEVLKLSVIGPTGANLSAIGGSAKSGVMLCSNEVTKAEEFILINQSVTGLFENKIDLLTV